MTGKMLLSALQLCCNLTLIAFASCAFDGQTAKRTVQHHTGACACQSGSALLRMKGFKPDIQILRSRGWFGNVKFLRQLQTGHPKCGKLFRLCLFHCHARGKLLHCTILRQVRDCRQKYILSNLKNWCNAAQPIGKEKSKVKWVIGL